MASSAIDHRISTGTRKTQWHNVLDPPCAVKTFGGVCACCSVTEVRITWRAEWIYCCRRSLNVFKKRTFSRGRDQVNTATRRTTHGNSWLPTCSHFQRTDAHAQRYWKVHTAGATIRECSQQHGATRWVFFASSSHTRSLYHVHANLLTSIVFQWIGRLHWNRRKRFLTVFRKLDLCHCHQWHWTIQTIWARTNI